MSDISVTRRSKGRDQNKQRRDSDPPVALQREKPDFLFTYDDSDTLLKELAEWYAYTEDSDFNINRLAFEEALKLTYDEQKKWKDLSEEQKKDFVKRLLNQTQIDDKKTRLDAYRSVLYIAQNVFGECESLKEFERSLDANNILLHECDTFSVFTDLLYCEVEDICMLNNLDSKKSPGLDENTELRCVLSVLYSILEIVRFLPEENRHIKEKLKNDLNNNLNKNSELLSIYLFNLLNKFCNKNAYYLPVKKIILLLWKVLLFSMGGLNEIFQLKNEKRQKLGLAKIDENPTKVLAKMSPATPPPTPTDLANEIQTTTNNPNVKKNKKSGLTKQKSGLDTDEFLTNGLDDNLAFGNEDDVYPSSPRPKSPDFVWMHLPLFRLKTLPWKPKVRQADIEAFLDLSRKKFLGYGDMTNDLDTLVGLPLPIHESVRILKQHWYVSLAEHQLKQEEIHQKYPFSKPESKIDATPAEKLYSNLLPNMTQSLICLLKILLASVPQNKQKADSIYLFSDLYPSDLQNSNQVKLNVDANRHKEILIKAISAILLLMLKHFKVNHVYQFEYMSQHLLFSNCVPLILKFFNLNVSGFIKSKNNYSCIDFPNCIFEKTSDLNLVDRDCETTLCRWRNVFSCVNLLRVLNKLTKNKRSRIMMLVIFKSTPILKKVLRIKHIMIQYYALKLLKMQTRNLGRQWRKANMTTMSAIYHKVRHRLNDDWAYGNEMETQQWDFQADECALRTKIDRFNQRRYRPEEPLNVDDQPVDNSLDNNLERDVELPENFEENYEKWLDEEVFSNEINWDALTRDNVLVLH